MGTDSGRERIEIRGRETRIVSLIFLMLIVAKCILVSGTEGPIITDEVVYKANALRIFRGQFLDTILYPPLYSVLQSIAFLSKDHWYGAMRVINAVVSSTAIIPVWLIARGFLPGSLALAAVVITALWPFQATYPAVLLSENLYVPLFLFSIYLLVKMGGEERKFGLVLPAFFGVLTAAAYLTRFIHLVAIPPLVVLWFLQPLFRDNREERAVLSRSRLYEFLAIVVGFALVYLPWLVYARHSGLGAGAVMGGRFMAIRLPSADVRSLMLWISFYLSYSILACAPYLLFFSVYAFTMLSRSARRNQREAFFTTAVLLLSGVFFATSVQHSWLALYNYPYPNRVMGRYLMHFYPLYLIVFLIGLDKIRDSLASLDISTIVLAALLSCDAILFAQGVLFRSPFWHLKFDFVNSPAGVPYQFAIFTALILLGVVVLAALLALGRRNPIPARRLILPFSLFLILFIQVVSCFGAYQWSVLRNRQVVHGKVLSEFLRDEMRKNDGGITLVYDIPSASKLTATVLSFAFRFWLSLPAKGHSVDIILAKDHPGGRTVDSRRTYLLTTEGCDAPLLSYVIAKKEIPFSAIIGGWILDRYPQWGNMARDQRYYLCDTRPSETGPRVSGRISPRRATR